MQLVDVKNLKTDESPAPASAALPVVFGTSPGLFTRARGDGRDVAVLFVSPWGFEELSVRKFWRILSETLADQGYSSLRFDLAGTGNALDLPQTSSLADWQNGIVEAADRLRHLAGCGRIVLVGHGLGAALAASACHRLGTLGGMALLAPVLSGRLYMRELALWARMTDGKPDPEKELREGRGFWISGFRLPDGICRDLRGLSLSADMLSPCRAVFLAHRPDRPGELGLASALDGLALDVTRIPYDGYDKLIANLNFSEQPAALTAALSDWMRNLPSGPAPNALGPVPVDGAVLAGDGFVETPVRFGGSGRLLGVLCQPADGRRRGATVVMLSTAYHPNAGWGRIGVDAARALARQGIASLRFDPANAADSPPLPGAPEQILYSAAQNLDVEAAVDFVERSGLLPAVIAGRCSGGYLAFRSILNDIRIKGAVCANPYVFFWDGSQSVDELLRFVPKPLANYGAMLLRSGTWRRILAGEIEVRSAVVNVSRGLAKRLLHASQAVLQLFPFLSREHMEVHAAFKTLNARNAAISLLYADDDPGIAHLVDHFGERGRKLTAYPNVTIRLLSDTDHNLSTPEARTVFAQELLEMALRFPPAET